MRMLRTVGVLALVGGLLLGGFGSVFGHAPADDGPHCGDPPFGMPGGFFGTVSDVEGGNITITTPLGWTVELTVTEMTRYLVPGEIMEWVDLAGLEGTSIGGLEGLEGQGVAVLAINVEKINHDEFSGIAMMVVVIPEPPVLPDARPFRMLRGFFGNVTEVSDGIVTLVTKRGLIVELTTVPDTTRYKVPGETWGWVGLTGLEGTSVGGLKGLEGRRVAVLAINVEKINDDEFSGIAMRVLVIPEPWVRLHHHCSGVVTGFADGAISIKDVHGVSHPFGVNGISCRPEGATLDSIKPHESFVTVVTIGDPKLGPVAKTIVQHRKLPGWWRR